MSATQKFSRIPFILITSLFLVWGLANNMTDTLLAAFKRILSMSDFQTSWIQFAFYGSYFCLAIPAALFIKRFSYKSGVLLGLGMFIAGSLLFYPASISMEYNHFLTSLFILAGGLAILETTANRLRRGKVRADPAAVPAPAQGPIALRPAVAVDHPGGRRLR
jgi:FHS family L-fucose permease-like MFS transporter